MGATPTPLEIEATPTFNVEALRPDELPANFPDRLLTDVKEVRLLLKRLKKEVSYELGKVWTRWRADPYFIGRPKKEVERFIEVVFGRDRSCQGRDTRTYEQWGRMRQAAVEQGLDWDSLTPHKALALIATPRRPKEIPPRPEIGEAGAKPLTDRDRTRIVPVAKRRAFEDRLDGWLAEQVPEHFDAPYAGSEALYVDDSDQLPEHRGKVLVRVRLELEVPRSITHRKRGDQ
jgi:hypothetical protein